MKRFWMCGLILACLAPLAHGGGRFLNLRVHVRHLSIPRYGTVAQAVFAQARAPGPRK